MLLRLICLALLGVTVINGQSECQCGGFIVKGTYSEWFYSFLHFFHESCDALPACKKDCLEFVTNVTSNGDLAAPMPGENMSVGDWICKRLNHDVETGTTVQFEYQLCVSDWFDTGLKSTFPFCCINGDYPEKGCPKELFISFVEWKALLIIKVKAFSKVFAPLRAQAASVDGGFHPSILSQAVDNGRQWLRGLQFLWKSRRPGKGNFKFSQHFGSREESALLTSTITKSISLRSCLSSGFNPFQRLLSRLFNGSSESRAAQLRKEAAKRLMFGSRESGPILALVGFALVSKDGLLTPRDKMETICQDVRNAVLPAWYETMDAVEDDLNDIGVLSLRDLQLGDVIAKGCNAIVHAARWKNSNVNRTERRDSEDSDDSGTDSSIEVLSSEEDVQENTVQWNDIPNIQTSSTKQTVTMSDLCGKFDKYPLAVKMMFNYDAESNAQAILRAMYKEIIPVRQMVAESQMDIWGNGTHVKKKHLPPHPNIVDLKCMFADSVPYLPQAMSLYPDALPRRLNRSGAGRNMTLFLVMKRYHCSLEDYLKAYNPPSRTCLLLLAQLFEGIAHLTRHQIAHRDLKTDNILLDLSDGIDCPRLVITDFGCCLAIGDLKLPYFTEETAKGGNSALMAPEIACARPGPYVYLDYGKADLWAAGALAYEILGQRNPFYRTRSSQKGLDCRFYNVEDLPKLSDKAHVVLEHLIKNILQRDPIKRPTADVAANVCELLLFGPQEWSSKVLTKFPNEEVIMHWLVSQTAQTLLFSKASEKLSAAKSLKHSLAISFLQRATLDSLSATMQYFHKIPN